MDFDPYTEWLGIPPGRRPPDYYALLGLPLRESDQAKIRAAAADRTAEVARRRVGKRSKIALDIADEISTAFDCLCDLARKAAYDAELPAARSSLKPIVLPPRADARDTLSPSEASVTSATDEDDDDWEVDSPYEPKDDPEDVLPATDDLEPVQAKLVAPAAELKSLERRFTIVMAVVWPAVALMLAAGAIKLIASRSAAEPDAPARFDHAAIANQVVFSGSSFEFQLPLAEPTPQTVRYRIESALPPGAEFDETTGKFTWTPAIEGPFRPYVVHALVASDHAEAVADSAIFQIIVRPPPDPPKMATISSPAPIAPGQSATFRVHAQVPKAAFELGVREEEIRYFLTAGALPDATLDEVTGDFAWTAPSNHEGGAYMVSIAAYYARWPDRRSQAVQAPIVVLRPKIDVALLPNPEKGTIEVTDEIRALSVVPDGSRLIALGRENGMHSWALPSVDEQAPQAALDREAKVMTVSAPSDLIALGRDDSSVRVYSFAGNKKFEFSVGSLLGDSVTALALWPDGQRLASGSSDGILRLNRLGDGAAGWEWPAHQGRITALAVSPAGDILASGGADTAIKIWSAADGMMLKDIRGHSDVVSALAVSPDGKQLFSGSWDGTILAWSAPDGESKGVIGRNEAPVAAIAVHPNGRSLFVAGADKVIRVLASVPANPKVVSQENQPNPLVQANNAGASPSEIGKSPFGTGMPQRSPPPPRGAVLETSDTAVSPAWLQQRPIFENEFDDPSNDFDFPVDERKSYENGGYVLRMPAGSDPSYVNVPIPIQAIPQDFAIEMVASFNCERAGVLHVRYGRLVGGFSYPRGITVPTSDGRYSSGTSSAYRDWPELNTVWLVKQGQIVRMYLNAHQVGSDVEWPGQLSGSFMISLSRPTPFAAEATIDRIRVWSLDGGKRPSLRLRLE